VEYAESLGIESHASFMIGLPDESDEDLDLTIEYAKKLPSRTLGFHIFHPLPGSEYGNCPSRYGLEFDRSFGDLRNLGAIDSVAPVKTKHLTPMRILDYYYMGRAIAEDRIQGRES
jgi:radical SAM superfamily enzyme YgiQ (UPF0313 family)